MARFGGHTEKRRAPLAVVLAVAAALIVAAWLVVGFVQDDLRARAAATMRDAILNAAAQCCAIEGSYPETLEYLEEHYGVRIDRDSYVVTYDAFASNVLPTVVVVPR